MRKIIKNFYENFKNLNHEYKITILAAANTFYMILLVIPLNNIGFEFTNIKIIDFLDIYKWGIVFLVNIIFVGTRYLDNLKETSEVIYQKNVKTSLKDYFKTLLLTIVLIIVTTTLVVISYGLISLWNNVIKTPNYYFVKFLEIIVTYGILLLIVTMIFKYTIPIAISFKKTLKITLFLSLIWLLMSTVYQNLHIYLKYFNVQDDYQVIITIYFMYVVNYLLVLSFIYNFWQTKNELNRENITKYNEH